MRFKFFSTAEIPKLPKNPGIYCFKDRKRNILYIGKAANIRERVKNHFLQPTYRDNLFINQVEKIGFIKTNSEVEALILEANLIKKYQPKYNVVWRDDKNYFFVGITTEGFPKIFVTHQPKSQNTKYQTLNTKFVGPFVDGSALKQTLKILRKVFPYRSCNKIPRHPCLWHQLNRCLAPCTLKSKLAKQIARGRASGIGKEAQRNAKSLLKILQGKKKQALNNLKKEMKEASASRDFEKAAKIRDQIKSLEKVMEHSHLNFTGQNLSGQAKIFEPEVVQEKTWSKTQKILQGLLKTKKTISRIEAYDVSNIQGKEATGSMVVFTNGKPDKNQYRKFKVKIAGKPNDVAMIKEILSRRFKHPEWPYPDLILIDGGRGQLNAAISVTKYKLQNTRLPSASPQTNGGQAKYKIQIMALAKKKNELFIEGRKKPILLKNAQREIFNLILQLRDEAHRFAVKYHIKLRGVDFLPKFL